jgi:hypothetical protein
MKDPLMARLLQLSEDFRNRYAKAEAVDERPLSDLDFARELKKRNRVDDGRSMVASLEQCFLRGALKYEAAFAVYGIPFLQARANQMCMFANSFRDTKTTIRTLLQIEQERMQDAIAGRQAKIEARRAAILGLCKENGWPLNTYALAGRLMKRLAKDHRFRDKDGKLRFPVSRRSIADDLIFLATTSSPPNE